MCWEWTRVAQGPECCPPLPTLKAVKLPLREASELCVHSSSTHQAQNQLPSKVNSGSPARKAPKNVHSIAWAQLHTIGARCLHGAGKEGSLPTSLVLLLHLPHGGFWGKLLPCQGAVVMCENKRKLIWEEEASGYPLKPTLFAGQANTKKKPNPAYPTWREQESCKKPQDFSDLQITPQCGWTLTETLISHTRPVSRFPNSKISVSQREAHASTIQSA